YSHYSGTFDLDDAVGKVPQDVFKPGVTSIIKQVSAAPGAVELWLDPVTALPRRLKMAMTITVVDSTVTTKLVMDYDNWNELVDVPPVPQDAKPFSDLTGGVSPADISYIVQFQGWLTSFRKHLDAIQSLPDSADAKLTDDQRRTVEQFL